MPIHSSWALISGPFCSQDYISTERSLNGPGWSVAHPGSMRWIRGWGPIVHMTPGSSREEGLADTSTGVYHMALCPLVMLHTYTYHPIGMIFQRRLCLTKPNYSSYNCKCTFSFPNRWQLKIMLSHSIELRSMVHRQSYLLLYKVTPSGSREWVSLDAIF